MKKTSNLAYDILRSDFLNIPKHSRMGVYLNITATASNDEICAMVDKCADDCIGLIIPIISGGEFDYLRPLEYLRIYSALLQKASENGIKVALRLDESMEGSVVRYFDDEDESIRSRILMKREYYCSNEEQIKIHVDESVLSVVAVEEDGGIIDLRGFCVDGELTWKAPSGNWRISRYFCSEDYEQDRVNILNYDACVGYLQSIIDMFKISFPEYMGKTLCAISFSDICFFAQNRRNWDEKYNKLFSELYGYDPAPYYPCLYDCSNDSQRRHKAALMDCRARLLFGGFMRAAKDVAEKEGMILLGSLAEPKISASSWTVGDALLVQSNMPCAKLERSYLYGFNSIEIAAGAAEMGEKETVFCEAFENYSKLSDSIIYRETATAFARGVNFMLAHLDEKCTDIKAYSQYVGRLQSVLGKGKNVSDIAVLYPIYSLHSSVSLYESPVPAGAFEYPETPDITDYMSIINSISFYSGQDLTVLHPDMLRSYKDIEDFSVVVIPATPTISIRSIRIISEYFDKGGKVICTGVLPSKACEMPADFGDSLDDEVKKLSAHIFGEAVNSENIIGDYIRNTSDQGGEAYFIYSTITGVDRCNIVPSSIIADILLSFGIAYDVYMEHMPRMESTGALNTNYPEYCMLGLSSSIRGGGMLNYIHKRRDELDIYFFSNATDNGYNGDVYMFGEHTPRMWDIASGAAIELDHLCANFCGQWDAHVGIMLRVFQLAIL